MDGSLSTFRNWYKDEPSCGSEFCVVMYHQPSAPTGTGGPYKFQWNDDQCRVKNNYICKYSHGERTEPAIPILPEDTEREDDKETLKENKCINRTLLGKIDNGTLLITNSPQLRFLLSPSHNYSTMELDRAFVTLQKLH